MNKVESPVWIARHNEVAVVNIQYEKVNALSRRVRREMMQAMEELDSDTAVKAIVISGGVGRFLAGADIRELNTPPSEPFLPDLVARIEATRKPVIAAIDGAALGGGFEIALACDFRIGTKNAVIGLPECRLGLIPGAGGTQRLPRLVGVSKAIELICESRILKAAEAHDLGLLDTLVDENDLLEVASSTAIEQAKRFVSQMPIPEGDIEADEGVERNAIKKVKGIPAVAEAARVIRAARSKTFAQGLALERATFLHLRDSDEARALVHVFLAEREAQKLPGIESVPGRPFTRTAVVGAGSMGAGIAATFADAGLSVVLVERDKQSVAAGLERVHEIYARQVNSRRLTREDADKRIERIIVTLDWSMLADRSLIVEAVFEDLETKVDVFRRLDKILPQGAVLASNTSYLDIDVMAASTSRPQDVVGLHFFAPANVMKLLEIVKAKETAPDVIATAMELAKKLGKQPIVAGPCDGFIGNRIYAAYRRHAEYLIEDGASPEQVDSALESYGFAMGVFAVSDMSGLDIAFAMRKRRATSRDPRERYVQIPDRLCELGRLGRKVGAGWYSYDKSGARHVDPITERTILESRQEKGIVSRSYTADEIQRRLIAVMANEGAKVLSEGIAFRASDIDLVFINGYGFPRTKGGPMWAADRVGLHNILREVEAAYAAGGTGSEPARLLIELAGSGRTFSEWRRP